MRIGKNDSNRQGSPRPANSILARVKSFRGMASAILSIVVFGAFLYGFQSRLGSRNTALAKLSNTPTGSCVVPLPEGRVLITGGEDSSGPTNAVQILDSAGVVTSAAPMLSAHADHVCAPLQDGRILVAGG